MNAIMETVVSQLIAFAVLAIVALVAAKIYVGRLRQSARDYAPWAQGVVRQQSLGGLAGLVPNPVPPDAPKTFSGFDHESHYQAPEVVAEILERERDKRWSRAQRLQFQDRSGPPSEGQKKAVDALTRANKAKSFDELTSLDMQALGLPCVRCGRKAEEHPEFPLCTRTTTVHGAPLPLNT